MVNLPKKGQPIRRISEVSDDILDDIVVTAQATVEGIDEADTVPVSNPFPVAIVVDEVAPVAVAEGRLRNARGSAEGDQMVQVAFEGANISGAEGVFVQGSVPHDDPDVGRPVGQGLRATGNISALADVSEADRVRALGTLKGATIIAGGPRKTGDGNSGATTTFLSEEDNEQFLGVVPLGLAPDNLTDRISTAGDSGPGLGAQVTSPTGHSHNNVTGDEQILAGAGKLHTITIHDVSAAGVITIYDSLTEAGTVIAILNLAGVAQEKFKTLHYDVACLTGLFIGYDGAVAANLTVSTAI